MVDITKKASKEIWNCFDCIHLETKKKCKNCNDKKCYFIPILIKKDIYVKN